MALAPMSLCSSVVERPTGVREVTVSTPVGGTFEIISFSDVSLSQFSVHCP